MFGRSLTGRDLYPCTPKIIMPIMTKAVITGRRMNRAVRFMCSVSYDIKGARTGASGQNQGPLYYNAVQILNVTVILPPFAGSWPVGTPAWRSPATYRG